TFVLELPLSVSMANLLLVQVGGELYGVPLHRVLLTTEYDLSARGGEGFEARSLVVMGELVRAYGLAKLFGLPSLAPPGPRPFVVMEVDGLRFAISVDRLVGPEEAGLKPLFPPPHRRPAARPRQVPARHHRARERPAAPGARPARARRAVRHPRSVEARSRGQGGGMTENGVLSPLLLSAAQVEALRQLAGLASTDAA